MQTWMNDQGTGHGYQAAGALRKLPEPIVQAIEAGRVPTPPQLLLRLMQIVDDDGATMAELARLVEQDAGLVTRILTAANSPALRRSRGELENLEACLMALGTRLVRSIATCLSIQNLFDKRSGLSAADLAAFWAHSLAVAELARSLAAEAGYPRPDEAFLAGLMHDVGELLLLSALGDPYAELLAEGGDEAQRVQRELARFGVHHGEIGTWLVDRWRLDGALADGILYHHAAADEIGSAAALPQAVWLAQAAFAEAELGQPLFDCFQGLCRADGSVRLPLLRDQAEARTQQLGAALGLKLPDQLCGLRVWSRLKVSTPAPSEEDEAEAEMAARLGGMALMQPLQQDLSTLDDDADMLFALRESARILFDLSELAFVLCTADERLTGRGIRGQPPVFGQFDVALDDARSLAVSALSTRQIVSSFVAERPVSLIDQQLARGFGSEGLLCVPLLARSTRIGVMVCGVSRGQHGRLARRLPWLLNFGRIAAISLEAVRDTRDYRAQLEEEAAGRFSRQARRVVHEAGNPLGIIKSYLKILDRKLPEGVNVRQELGILTEEIDRVASIVRRMSEIPQAEAAGDGLDVAELLRELLALYGEPLFGAKGIKLESQLPSEAQRVACERDSLKQILVNLWKNASEALSAGQQMRVALGGRVIHNGLSHILLTLEDTGPGMPEAAMRSLHAPVEQAGANQRGMGLSIVGALAGKQGIAITCRSQPGEGTRIELLLPGADSARPGTEMK